MILPRAWYRDLLVMDGVNCICFVFRNVTRIIPDNFESIFIEFELWRRCLILSYRVSKKKKSQNIYIVLKIWPQMQTLLQTVVLRCLICIHSFMPWIFVQTGGLFNLSHKREMRGILTCMVPKDSYDPPPSTQHCQQYQTGITIHQNHGAMTSLQSPPLDNCIFTYSKA